MRKIYLLFSLLFLFLSACTPAKDDFEKEYSVFKDTFSGRYEQIRTAAAYDSLKDWAEKESKEILKKYEDISLTDSALAKKADLLAFAEENAKAVQAFEASFSEWKTPAEPYIAKYLELLISTEITNPDRRKKIDKALAEYRNELGGKYFSTYLYYGYEMLDNNLTGPAEKAFDAIIKEDTSKKYAELAVYEKSSILMETKGKDSALSFLRGVLPNYPNSRMISEKIKQLELIGKKAVEPDVKYWLGKAIPLKTLRGKVVMLDFWAPWCGPCREAFPGLKELYEQFHHRGFEIISLTNYYPFYRDDREVVKEASAEVYDKKLKEFIKRFALPWSILMAENNSNREKYSVSFIPTFFLIDKSGIIRYAQVGTRKDKNHLKRKIESLLK